MKRLAIVLAAVTVIVLVLWSVVKPDNSSGLASIHGPVELSAPADSLQLVYIGYMSCPDVCPTALSRLGAALHQLPEAKLARIQPYFVSVDPKRDTLANLALYSGYFHPRITGVSGEQPAIDRLVNRLQAFYRVQPLDDSALGYAVDHSANYYLLDHTGELLETLPDNLSTELLLARLDGYLK